MKKKASEIIDLDIDRILNRNEVGRTVTGAVGVVIYCLGLNLFIVPLGLYSGGLMGVCQLLRTLLAAMGMGFGSFDISGVIYYILSVPLMFLAYKLMNALFVRKLIILVTVMTMALSVITVPARPFVEEPLTGCLIGGIICGFGIGVYLRAGCSAGGMEIVGIYLTRSRPHFSVGKMNMAVNAVVYSICLLCFEPSVVIYSVIYSVVCSLLMDKVHSQNISVEAIIISKTNNQEIEAQIMSQLGRGITYWKAQGGYTGEQVDVMITVLSKYEVATLRRIVYGQNPHAFMVVKEGLSVNGNFAKHM